MSQDKIFARGIFFKDPSPQAPSYVLGKLKIKTDEALEFINEQSKDGWLTLDIKKSQGGKTYLEVDTYVPKTKEDAQQQSDKAPF